MKFELKKKLLSFYIWDTAFEYYSDTAPKNFNFLGDITYLLSKPQMPEPKPVVAGAGWDHCLQRVLLSQEAKKYKW